MDIATLFGLALGVVLMIGSIMSTPGASLGAFVDPPSVAIVLGGAAAATLISMPLRSFLGGARAARVVLFNERSNPSELVARLVSLAEIARRDGILALETHLEETEDRFVALGLQLAIDGNRPELIEDILRTEMEAVALRHQSGKKVLDQIGRFAPAFGMIGTLLGLIMMLGNLDDPSSLGPGMAVALITTLYGSVLANLFVLPAADKLACLNRDELRAMEIVVRGILAIQSGENPRVVEQKLMTFLPPQVRAAEGGLRQAA